MTKRINVRANMSAERNGIGRRTHAAFQHQVAMFLGETEQKRRMTWVMRHAHEVRLGKVVHFRSANAIEKLFHLPRFSTRRVPGLWPLCRARALPGVTGGPGAAHRPRRYCR